MTRRIRLLLIVLALVAAACGNRSGGDDTSSAPEPGATDEVPEGGGATTTDVGITDDTITIGVVADLTGVVPGLFKAAVDAVEAYAAKVNSEGGVNGRTLVVEVFDTGTNDRGNGRAYEEACDKVFASVGSASAFDSGGSEAIRECGFPMVNAIVTDDDVEASEFVFPRQGSGYANVGAARYLAEQHPEAVKNAAIFYVNTPSIKAAAEDTIAAREEVGWEFDYVQPVGQLEANYAPHAIEMKSRGIEAFTFVGDDNNIIRLEQALRDQQVGITVADVSSQGYSQDFVDAVGPAGEGGIVPLSVALIEDAPDLPAMQEYLDWLEKVAPGESPNFNGVLAWTRTMLFVQAVEALGDDLTRESLIEQLASITDFDADGLLPPDDVGDPVPAEGCFALAQIVDGRYQRAFPDSGFHCSPDDVFALEPAG